MKAAGATFDVSERKKLYRKVFDRINDQAYIIPIAGLSSVFVHTNDLEIAKGAITPFGAQLSKMNWK